MQHTKSKKILDFAANVRLSRIQADGDVVCELPVVKGGQAIFPCVLLIFSSIYSIDKLFGSCLNLLLSSLVTEYFSCF